MKLDNLSKKSAWRRGFTVVELLVVIVVIGILATLVVVAYRGAQNKAIEGTVSSDLRNAGETIEVEQAHTGAFPETLALANDGKGLDASSGTTYQYTVDNEAQTYCLTATNGSIAYHIVQDGVPEEGVCPGHDEPDGDGGEPEPLVCPAGFIVVPGNSTFGTSDFCVAKYEAKNVGGVATSQASGTPWVSITQPNAITAAQAACSGCDLITEEQWLTIVHNVLNVASNWSGGSVGSGYIYSGHNDNSPASLLAASSNDSDGYVNTGNSSGTQRRTLTLSNGEVIWDLAANAWEWTNGTVAGGQPGASGFAWRQWNAVSTHGTLSPDPFPAYGTPAASVWTKTQGIGSVYSNSTTSSPYGKLRGGTRDSGSEAGIFALSLTRETYYTYSDVSFRITKQ